MHYEHSLPLERLLLRIKWAYDTNKTTILTSLISGMLAHGYAFTNKLMNHDEMTNLFSKGVSISSGRWGLELTSLIFPNYSMPWIYGIISLLLMAAATCLIVSLLGIRSKPIQAILAALIITFPSMTGNFCFMFTSSAYAFSFLLSVLCVYEFQNGGKFRLYISTLFMVLSLSIYQAYISVAACLFILLMLADALDKDSDPMQIVQYGIKALFMLLLSVAIYYGILLLVFRFTGLHFNNYVANGVAERGILARIKLAYFSFFEELLYRKSLLISSRASRYLHVLLGGGMLFCIGAVAYNNKKLLHALLVAVLLGLIPLAIECMYFIMEQESIHSLVLYAFASIYMLAAMLIDRFIKANKRILKDIMTLSMLAIVIMNIYFANMCYLKMTLQYENMSSFYSSMLAVVKNTEGFDDSCTLALVGQQDNLLYPFEELNTRGFKGPVDDLINVYYFSKLASLKYYLAFDIPLAYDYECNILAKDDRVISMPEYPYYGSIKRVDDYMVVKFG